METAVWRWSANAAIVLLTLATLCGAGCSLGISPAHDWLMRHHCPFAMLPHYSHPQR
jgi:hypothetical protein